MDLSKESLTTIEMAEAKHHTHFIGIFTSLMAKGDTTIV
ncbi:hypothetical protein SAMN05216308_101142 [Nitrosospira sp. Nsp13]|nr:hypothetical protein SAMN05216308_101142 [Nitrosospira sp. Nsp13]